MSDDQIGDSIKIDQPLSPGYSFCIEDPAFYLIDDCDIDDGLPLILIPEVDDGLSYDFQVHNSSSKEESGRGFVVRFSKSTTPRHWKNPDNGRP